MLTPESGDNELIVYLNVFKKGQEEPAGSVDGKGKETKGEVGLGRNKI